MATQANEIQQKVIDTLKKPVQVSAGAGAGKTWTLSMRLVNSFMSKSDVESESRIQGGGEAHVSTPEQILGVTFTEKAAAELAHRVKRMLKSAGLTEVSCKIDEAWISTIDSMCKRIVKEHAFSLGIDPAFDIRDSAECELIKEQLIRELIEEIKDSGGKERFLFEAYGYDGLAALLCDAIEKIAHLELPETPRNFAYGTAFRLPHLMLRVEPVMHDLRDIHMKDQPKKAEELDIYYRGIFDEIETFKQKYGAYTLHKEHPELNEDPSHIYWSDAQLCVELLNILCSADKRPQRIRKPKEGYGDFLELLADIRSAIIGELNGTLLGLARELRQRYDNKACRDMSFDFTQIENLCLRLLRNHEELRRAYQNQFKVIMVDEYQDTNPLQNEIIGLLAGENLQHLCTVGDEQQSIYGFRGGDVETYREHKSLMREKQAEQLEMKVNYRSHDHILRYVDDVFGNREVFGDKLLPLAAGRIEVEPSYVEPHKPRIIELQSEEMLSLEERARHLAKELARLRDEEGVSPGDICVLFSKLKGVVGVYKAALQEQGFKVLVQGGSGFYDTSEIKLLCLLRHWLHEPHRDDYLASLLVSELFTVSEESLALALLELDSAAGGGERCRGSLWHRLKTFRDLSVDSQVHFMLPDVEKEKLISAIQILELAYRALGKRSLVDIIEAIIESCFYDIYLLKQGVEGDSRYVNILKYFDIIKGLEAQCAYNFAALSKALDAKAAEKEAPASLSASDAVRLMTIHASKGLEFPVVASVDVQSKYAMNRDKLAVERIKGELYGFSLSPLSNERLTSLSKHKANDSVLKHATEWILAEVEEYQYADLPISYYEHLPAEFLAHYLKEAKRASEHEEDYRKYYVAFTRAREQLLVEYLDISYEGRPPKMQVLSTIMSNLTKPADKDAKKDECTRTQLPAEYETQTSSYRCLTKRCMVPVDEATEGTDMDAESSASEEGACVEETKAGLIATKLEREERRLIPVPFLFEDILPAYERCEADELYTLPEDSGFATSFGTQAHRLAQSLVLKAFAQRGFAQEDTLSAPCSFDEAWVERESASYLEHLPIIEGFNTKEIEHLKDLVRSWFKSETWKKCYKHYKRVLAELEVSIPLEEDGELKNKQGFIDMYFYNKSTDAADKSVAADAIILDFKTGYKGLSAEEFELLVEFQAKKYAYVGLLHAQERGLRDFCLETIFYRLEDEQESSARYRLEDIPLLKARLQELMTAQAELVEYIEQLEKESASHAPNELEEDGGAKT